MAQRPISVLQFTNAVVRAGAENVMLTLLRGLDRELFRLHLVCPPRLLESLHDDLPHDIDVIPMDVAQPYHLRSMVKLARVLKNRRIDILHSHMFYSSLCASPVARLCGIPLIVETAHGREGWRKGWFKSRFFVDRMVGHCVTHYVAVSEATAGYLKMQKRLPPRKITVIPNGCDLARFLAGCAAVPGMKRELGFRETDSVLVVLGRLEPQKGHAVLIEGLPAVLSQFPATRLVCVGDGALRADLEKQVELLGLTDAVRFVGFQPDVRRWLALADISVLPSLYEGLPLTAIQTLAAGRAMVATAVDGTPEVVVHEKTGLTATPGNPAALATAICRLLGDAEMRQRLGRAGREWVLDQFSLQRQIQRTQQFYVDIWSQHASGMRAAADGPGQSKLRAAGRAMEAGGE